MLPRRPLFWKIVQRQSRSIESASAVLDTLPNWISVFYTRDISYLWRLSSMTLQRETPVLLDTIFRFLCGCVMMEQEWLTKKKTQRNWEKHRTTIEIILCFFFRQCVTECKANLWLSRVMLDGEVRQLRGDWEEIARTSRTEQLKTKLILMTHSDVFKWL